MQSKRRLRGIPKQEAGTHAEYSRVRITEMHANVNAVKWYRSIGSKRNHRHQVTEVTDDERV